MMSSMVGKIQCQKWKRTNLETFLRYFIMWGCSDIENVLWLSLMDGSFEKIVCCCRQGNRVSTNLESELSWHD